MTRSVRWSHSGAYASVCLALAVAPIGGQETMIRGFADVTYAVSDRGTGSNTFSLGQYDLFISSRLGEKWSFLGETVFEFVGDDFVADVERVVIEYRQSPQLRIAAGRMHTPVGYWLTAYHHGALLEPTIDRPLAFRFEDEGGLLASHQVGFRVSGSDVGSLNLGYDILVGNGVSSSPVEDLNEGKSTTVRLYTQVDHATQVGGFFSRDKLEAGTPLPGLGQPNGGGEGQEGLAEDLSQHVFGAFLTHFGSRLEFQTEALRIRNREDSGTTTNESFYAYSGYRFGAWVPYVLYDRVDFAEHDPYYRSDSHSHVSLGLRWDALGTTVVKAEGRRENGHPTGVFHTLTFQVAVGF